MNLRSIRVAKMSRRMIDRRSALALMLLASFSLGFPMARPRAQSGQPDRSWLGARVVILKGFGEVNATGADGKPEIKRIPNVVAPIARLEGDRVWLICPGCVVPTGWLDRTEVVLLRDAVPHFTSLIEKDSKNWDAYFRRAEAHHATNQREEAIADYTTAISLRPNDPYLYARRARSFHAMKACDKALADYDTVIRLEPKSAEAFSVQASIYTSCPDTRYQDLQKAIAAAQRAIALDGERPTFLTILATAYAKGGQLEEAVKAQKQAVDHPKFPPGYYEEA